MLLGNDRVVEAGHEVNAVAQEIDWQASDRVTGTLAEWRQPGNNTPSATSCYHQRDENRTTTAPP